MTNGNLNKNLLLYEASAGSGKTFTLVNYYLKKILANKENCRSIIAVTFTNKAVNELKTRILDELHILAGKPNDSKHLDLLLGSKKNETTIIEISNRARISLFNITHNYDLFTVTTIDSFFKGIVASFYSEINLFGDYTIELNIDSAINYVIDSLLKDNQDTQTMSYLSQFAINKLLSGNSWDIKENLRNLVKELFSGFYMNSLSSFVNNNTSYNAALNNNIEAKLTESKKQLIKISNNFNRLCTDNNLNEQSFPRGVIYKYILGIRKDLSVKNISKILGSKTYQEAVDYKGAKIFKKTCAINNTVENDIVTNIEDFHKNATGFLSYSALKENLYIYFILQKCESLVNRYREEKKILFISDITYLLNKLTKGYGIEFIYEKVGNKYEHYLIDEFQDTSKYQWQNFKTLVEETLARVTGSTLIVGDQKQSIYRWREASSHENINDIYKNFNSYLHTETLSNNYRSAKNIVSFNNFMFEALPKAIHKLFNTDLVSNTFKNAKQVPSSTQDGYISLEFLQGETTEFSQTALRKTISEIEKLQDIGYSGCDITILVRNQKQSEAISIALIQAAQNSHEKYNYNFISEEGLCIANFTEVRDIINIFKLITEPNNKLYYAQAIITLNHNTKCLESPVEIDYSIFPPALKNLIESAFSIPLHQLCSETINILEIETDNNRLVLDSFQNIILNFQLNTSNNLYDFLQYWEDEGKTKKLQTSINEDAINILTIHKSKGLEFKAVLIPFCSWPLDENIIQTSSKILWVKSDEFTNSLPILYKNYLQYTKFKDAFTKEKHMSILDSINMLYVALTRSIIYMKILCPKPKNEKNITKISDLIFYIINSKDSTLLHNHYNNITYQFEIGTFKT
ncbi:MAG: UvrD-helicase domain-containing protein [Solitalea-like symbiont of Tyrophagus putrescentiae]